MQLVVALVVWVLPFVGHGFQAMADEDQIRYSLERGAYEDAERVARQLSTSMELERGSDSIEFARVSDLLVQALVGTGKASLPSTLALAERTLGLKEQHFGKDHPETAVSLHNLGSVYVERGEFGAALPLHERALSIRLRHLSPAVTDSLDFVASTLIPLERLDEARRALVRARAIREATLDPEPRGLARTMELIAWLGRNAGEYKEAQTALDGALALRQRQPAGHPDLAFTVRIQGDLLWLDGQVEKARVSWAEGLSIVERSLGAEHPTAAAFYRRLGLVANGLGSRTEARGFLQRGLKIAQEGMAPCNPELMALQEDNASSHTYDGEYTEAQGLYRRSVSSYEKCLGSGHSRTATAVHNLALLTQEMGDLVEAERLHQRAIRIWSTGLGPGHPYVARGLDALAEVVAARGQWVRARTLYERALDLRRRALGANHPDVAWTLANLARTVGQSGELALARRYVSQAIEIYERTGASDQPDHFARVLSLRGELESRRRDYVAAQASLTEALATRERIFGRSHPLAAETRAALASVDAAMGSYQVALDAALEAERAGRDHLRFTVRYLPERQALAYAAKRPKGLDLPLSIVSAGHLESTTAVFDSVIQSRGVILDELAARAQSTARAEPEIAAVNAAMVMARERFANLMVRSLEEGTSVSRSLLDEARLQKEDTERALAEKSATVRVELSRSSIGLDEVRRALPVNSALVSFIRYERSVPNVVEGNTFASTTTPSYIAFMMRSDATDIRAIPLGSAATLESLVMNWRREAAGRSLAAGASEAERRYRIAGERLRRRVWDSVAEHAKDVSHLFVVPDGALNLVNFAALPIDGNRYLVESSPFVHYVSTERDLVLPNDATEARGLFAVGGASFAGEVSRTASKRADVGSNRGATDTAAAVPVPSVAESRAGCGPLRFTALPGTKAEILEIAAMWPTTESVAVLTDRSADERAVKNGVVGRRVVHLATHGFFVGSRCEAQIAGTRAVGGLAKPPSGAPSGMEQNPLNLAGLAFAGANRRRVSSSQQDDGILTAEEVAGLNLQGTHWAVLSACDTGLGEIRAGEGVFGLRRAFQIAGARTVIMSLWSVEDRATRDWMRALYDARLRRQLGTVESVTEASRTVLAGRRAKRQDTHPFYWAAFVAAGDWR